ncbi:hypothetical protein C8R46DRAFT_1195021 [Mycena filopes]|nr:hypothetical protein C8R46DRAFT_1195021 [Mycena filopes]
MSANTRQRRKPAPKLDDDDADALSVLTVADPTPARHSFALYPDPPLPTPASPTPSSTGHGHGHGHSPHYTRRRAQSSSAHSEAANSPVSPPLAIPKSMSTSMAAPPAPRTRLARLLLPHGHASKVTSTSTSTTSTSTSASSKDAPGIRKHTISIPTPATLPSSMLPPELAAFVRAQKPVALRDLELPPPPSPPLLSPTSTSASGTSGTSGTSSSRASGETALTSPPRSPLSPWAPTSSCTSPTVPTFASTSTSPPPAPTLVSPASVTFADAPTSPTSPTSPRTSPTSLHTTKSRPLPTIHTATLPKSQSSRAVNRKPPPLAPLLPVSASALARAARLPLVAPSGVRVGFGEVLGLDSSSLPPALPPLTMGGGEEVEGENIVRPASTSRFVELLAPPASVPKNKTSKTRKTLVVFLRHFWCPLCQDYVVGLARAASAAKDGRENGEEGEGCGVCRNEEKDEREESAATATATATTLSSSLPANADAHAPNPQAEVAEAEEAAAAENADADSAEEGEGTHLVLIAPGAHTLAERYLASFGFPELSESTSTNSFPHHSSSPESTPPTKGVQGDAPDHPHRKRRGRGRGIASIRLFVDPRPQEGVYAALGMGWAGGASPPVSPTSPSSGLNEGGTGMESVGFVPGVPLPIPFSPKLTKDKKGKVGRSVSLPPVVFASAAGAAGGEKGMEKMGEKGEKRGEKSEWSAGRGFARGARGGERERGGIPRFEDSTTDAPAPTATTDASTNTATNPAAETAPATSDPDAAPTSYITHSALGGVGAVLLRALRAGMPVWERGGDVRLLGGEFVFEVGPPDTSTSTTNSTPTLRCTYAHRMQTTRGHASVARVFAAAGIYVPPESESDPTSRLGRSKSSGTLSRATAGKEKEKEKSDATGLPRTTSALQLGVASSASTSIVNDMRPAVPRSASTPPTAPGMFSRNVFARFAGPKGGRAMQGSATPRLPTTRERAQMPRSASTPPAPAGRRIGALWEQHHGWAHVGVIWEALEGDRQDKEREERDGREPAMKATLSASSSRPWALVGAGSSGSIVDDVSDPDRELEPPEQGSGSSSSVSISFVSPVRRTGSETTTASSASEPVSESDLGSVSMSRYQHPHPYAFDVGVGVGAGKHIYDGAEVWTDAEADGDDERSDGEEIRFAFPKRRSVGYARTYGDVGELRLGGLDGEVSECGAETGHHPPLSVHGRARSEQGGGSLVRVPTRKYATYAGHPHARSRATHGHGGAETELGESDEHGEGYEGDGYGGLPGDGEDVWMRARARSLARLKARKEMRRGGGV